MVNNYSNIILLTHRMTKKNCQTPSARWQYYHNDISINVLNIWTTRVHSCVSFILITWNGDGYLHMHARTSGLLLSFSNATNVGMATAHLASIRINNNRVTHTHTQIRTRFDHYYYIIFLLKSDLFIYYY